MAYPECLWYWFALLEAWFGAFPCELQHLARLAWVVISPLECVYLAAGTWFNPWKLSTLLERESFHGQCARRPPGFDDCLQFGIAEGIYVPCHLARHLAKNVCVWAVGAAHCKSLKAERSKG